MVNYFQDDTTGLAPTLLETTDSQYLTKLLVADPCLASSLASLYLVQKEMHGGPKARRRFSAVPERHRDVEDIEAVQAPTEGRIAPGGGREAAGVDRDRKKATGRADGLFVVPVGHDPTTP